MAKSVPNATSPSPQVDKMSRSRLLNLPVEIFLQVMQYVNEGDLERFARVCKGTSGLAEKLLYARDAERAKIRSVPKAMLYAAYISSIPEREGHAERLVARSLQYGGKPQTEGVFKIHKEGSTTAAISHVSIFHLAVAYGSAKMVSRLLKICCEWGPQVPDAGRFGISTLTKRLWGVKSPDWLLHRERHKTTAKATPLAYALERRDLTVANALLSPVHHGAPFPCFVVPAPFLPTQAWKHTTILNMLATIPEMTPLIPLVIEKNAFSVSLGHNSETPIHNAIKYYHEPLLKALLRASAAVERVDMYGRTPLINAIRQISNQRDENARATMLEMIKLLLQRGANPLAYNGGQFDESPLFLAVDAFKKLDGKHRDCMMTTVKLLIQGAQNLDLVMPNGQTIMSRVVGLLHAEIVRQGRNSMSKIVKEWTAIIQLLVDNGADINQTYASFNGGVLTLLGRAFRDNCVLLGKILSGLGAKIPPAEADAVLQILMHKKPVDFKNPFPGVDVRDMWQDISPRVAGHAFHAAYKSPPLTRWLFAWLPFPVDDAGALWSLETRILPLPAKNSVRKVWMQNVVPIIDARGSTASYIHVFVVDRLEDNKQDDKYDEHQAILDTDQFLLAGASVGDRQHRNKYGATVVDRVRRMKDTRGRDRFPHYTRYLLELAYPIGTSIAMEG